MVLKVVVRYAVVLVVLALIAAGAVSLFSGHRDSPPMSSDQLLVSSPASEGFARADGPRAFDFLIDKGPHEEFQTEWWYYTGNLETDNGRHFGYQLTFFRRASLPPSDIPSRDSDWTANQIYLAHFGLTDSLENRHYSDERFSRAGAGLAGAKAMPYRVWLESWYAEELSPEVVSLHARSNEVAVDLDLSSLKSPVLQGEGGYSPKGGNPGNASYYYSLTRLETEGVITIGDVPYNVKGLTWMDHEFSTSALDPGQIGWDWFGLQFDDGTELMLFQLRRSDGAPDPYSSGTIVDQNGYPTFLANDEFALIAQSSWTSPITGAEYPSEWTIRIPKLELEILITPAIADQEMLTSFIYWEGAVGVQGKRASSPISGRGYAELTGYAHTMEGRF